MTDRWEARDARRLDRVVSDLLGGRRLKVDATDAGDMEAIRTASRLAGSAAGCPTMSQECRQRLAAQIDDRRQRLPLSRRAALVAGFSAAGGIATGAVLERVAGLPAKPSGSPAPGSGDVMIPAAGAARWVDVGLAADDLQEGVPVRANAGAVQVFVVRHGQSVGAVSALCTHQPCVLTWSTDLTSLTCPCHGARFGVDGEPTWGPYRYHLPRLPRVPTRVLEGHVEVLGTIP